VIWVTSACRTASLAERRLARPAGQTLTAIRKHELKALAEDQDFQVTVCAPRIMPTLYIPSFPSARWRGTQIKAVMAPSLPGVQDALSALGRRALPPRGPVGPGRCGCPRRVDGYGVLGGLDGDGSPVGIRPGAIFFPASMVAPVGD
jgi:hypothetical protein